MNKCRVALLSALMASTGAMAADDVDLNIGGFIWSEIGIGDRYEANADEDRIGVSRAAITVSPEYKNTRAVFVLGANDIFNEEHFSNGSAGGNNVEFKEAFAGIKVDLLGGELDTTLGKQPLLFGLKPNGWVADRSVQQGLEFGGANGLNVSGQVQTALIANWSWGGGSGSSAVSSVDADGNVSVRFGFFDTDEFFGGPGGDGSTITDNFFVQVRADNLLGTGLYGSAGYEQVYQAVVDDSEGIYSFGIGWGTDMFDLSFEYQAIDQAIVGTPDDETQMIAEATFNLNENWSFYADYATADEADIDTLRVGAIRAYNEHLKFVLEYSDDSDDNNAFNDTDSIDLRMAFSF